MEDNGVLYDSGTHGEGDICQSADGSQLALRSMASFFAAWPAEAASGV